MFVSGFLFNVDHYPILIDRLTFDSLSLKEGYSSDANIVTLSEEQGLHFDQINQYLQTPVFRIQHAVSLRITWLAFILMDTSTQYQDVFSVEVGDAMGWIPASQMVISDSYVLQLDAQGEHAITLRFQGSWVDQGGYVTPIMQSLEVYDG